MIRINSGLGRFVSSLSVFALLNLYVPYFAIAAHMNGPKPAKTVVATMPESRPMSGREMRNLQGRNTRNPYVAGTQKWSVIQDGIDVATGNFTTSATDLSFEGGYGVPVNMTRSYSSNNTEEGPLGLGWTMSVDLRQTGGGLLKSPAAPVRTVGSRFKERPLAENDPNLANNPVEAVVSNDSTGKEETVQRDVDGILTNPQWDKDLSVPVYTFVTIGGALWRLTNKVTTTTPEGTVYVYDKHGTYPNGTRPYNNPNAPAEQSYVLKISSVTDRHGNVTTYNYSTSQASFQTANGTTSEDKLTSVSMPGGRALTFTWGDGSGSMPNTRRIYAVSDVYRTVHYTYDSNGCLATATTPAGFITSYEYGEAYQDPNDPTPGADRLLTQVTDPRGLVTRMAYVSGIAIALPYGAQIPDVFCYKVVHPNGAKTYVGNDPLSMGPDSPEPDPGNLGDIAFWQHFSPAGNKLSERGLLMGISPINPQVTITIAQFTPSGGGASFATIGSKTYSATSQDLLSESANGGDLVRGSGTFQNQRYLGNYSNWTGSIIQSDYTSNFLGNPISKSTTETQEMVAGPNQVRTSAVQYAYWGDDRYYQQKAVRMRIGLDIGQSTDYSAWRYSFTDYYLKTDAAAGNRGEVKNVYNQPFTTFASTGGPAPTGTLSQNVWKYCVLPQNTNAWSAAFTYDTKGRPVTVQKLRGVNGSTFNHVQTNTTYGLDGAPAWGNATVVTEDVGGINRLTQTAAFDSCGRAIDVIDPMGRRFHTNYDLDDRILSINRVDQAHPVVTYAYGNSGITNGQVTSVTDNLSGVAQNVSYLGSGSAVGMVSGTTEVNGTDSYSVTYTYNSDGDREVVHYQTPQGTIHYDYGDWISGGQDDHRMFRTLTLLDASQQPTGEQFHYVYDAFGRLTSATFAMTPITGQTGYSAAYPAATRGRAFYDLDAGGRVKSVEYYWDTWNANSSSYGSQPILKNSCTYDAYKGLKTTSSFWSGDGQGNWNADPDRTEQYGYDANLDYLTSVDYGDGLANSQQTWTYDAAGNRATDSVQGNGWSYDNLNRFTASPGFTYDSDLSGNRLHRLVNGSPETTYGWDDVNRMTNLANSSGSWTYAYRADGMRVAKANGTIQTKYRYAGQMSMQDEEDSGASTIYSNYAIGMRGLDRIERDGNVVYPIYDAHGNMAATLSSSSGQYLISNQRSYGAWGDVRQGGMIGDPMGHYCAAAGHKEDGESGLIYMRARYYDDHGGRFLSQDPGLQGQNLFAYCAGNPVSRIDFSGRFYEIDVLLDKAWETFRSCSVYGYGCAQTVMALQKIQGYLGDAVIWYKNQGQALIAQSQVDEASAPYLGATAGELQARIAELKADLAGKADVQAVVAQLSIGMIDVMIKLVQDGDPFFIWGE